MKEFRDERNKIKNELLLHYHNLDIKIDKHYSITDIYGYVVSDDRKNF